MNEVVGETQREVRVVLWTTSEVHADAHVSHKKGFFEKGDVDLGDGTFCTQG